MLEITRKSMTLEPEEVLQLESIITDENAAEALLFLKRVVYRRLLGSQENRLKCHLDGEHDPVGDFKDHHYKKS